MALTDVCQLALPKTFSVGQHTTVAKRPCASRKEMLSAVLQSECKRKLNASLHMRNAYASPAPLKKVRRGSDMMTAAKVEAGSVAKLYPSLCDPGVPRPVSCAPPHPRGHQAPPGRLPAHRAAFAWPSAYACTLPPALISPQTIHRLHLYSLQGASHHLSLLAAW